MTIEGIPLVGLTTPALLGLTILLLLTGKLVPRSALLDKIAEAERYRKAYEAEREARATSDAQTVELLELAKTTHDILVALFKTVEHAQEPESGGPRALPTAK